MTIWNSIVGFFNGKRDIVSHPLIWITPYTGVILKEEMNIRWYDIVVSNKTIPDIFDELCKREAAIMDFLDPWELGNLTTQEVMHYLVN